MSDLSRAERIEMHQGVAEWLRYQIRQVDRTLTQLETEEADERRRLEQERRAGSWKLQPARVPGAEPMLHRADCGLYKVQHGWLDREHAAVALEEFPGLDMCQICRPWETLGEDRPGGAAKRPPPKQGP